MSPDTADILANGVAVFHAVVLAVYVAGALSFLTGGFSEAPLRLWKRSYLVIAFAMSVSVVCVDGCPLTRLENAIRAESNPAACYDESFMQYYVPLVPPRLDAIGSLALLASGCAATFRTVLMWSRRHDISVLQRQSHRVS